MKGTDMNIYDAIMKAADQIERHPEAYSFGGSRTPDCGSPSCIFGWVGHFLGMRDACNMKVAWAMGLASTGELYDFAGVDGCGFNLHVPHEAASGLRAFARERFERQNPNGIPASVRAIFETVEAA